MHAELLLACLSGPLLATLLLQGPSRRLMAALAGGMLAAFLSGAVSGYCAALVGYDALAAALYISPQVEEGMKLALYLLLHALCPAAEAERRQLAVGIGVGFALLESVALLLAWTGGGLAWLMRALCSAMIHTACALMLLAAARLLHRLGPGRLCGFLGVYAATATVHALYNLLVSSPGAARLLGYALPAALIAGGQAVRLRRNGKEDATHGDA